MGVNFFDSPAMRAKVSQEEYLLKKYPGYTRDQITQAEKRAAERSIQEARRRRLEAIQDEFNAQWGEWRKSAAALLRKPQLTEWSIPGGLGGHQGSFGTPEIKLEIAVGSLKFELLNSTNKRRLAFKGIGAGVGVGLGISVPFANWSGSGEDLKDIGIDSKLLQGLTSSVGFRLVRGPSWISPENITSKNSVVVVVTGSPKQAVGMSADISIFAIMRSNNFISHAASSAIPPLRALDIRAVTLCGGMNFTTTFAGVAANVLIYGLTDTPSV